MNLLMQHVRSQTCCHKCINVLQDIFKIKRFPVTFSCHCGSHHEINRVLTFSKGMK